ncbi:MAG: nitronate monooxygenase [Candidatus Eisenbacteria bacterium]|uniref:Nitronate monooxygenase n=1 Tax=Eiseniibacteriota bacterium TaxID=2212470 RepID=A0A538TA48_UNCEI|nr:MAG: nitronate monooxygenase [Candidatus Eisenbacteria bacterium]
MDTVRTRVTDILHIRYPILQAGMIWAAGYKLAVACAEADILGTIGSAGMKQDLLRSQIQKARALTKKQIAVNIPLLRSDAGELLEIALGEGIDVIISSAGNPALLAARIQAADVTWIHVVPSVKHGKKAQDAGAHIVVGEGFEAGGHNGVDEITTLALIPQLVDALSVPVAAAGGIADGRGFLAAMALGAEGISVGTRFACTLESSSHPMYKEAVAAANDAATVLFAKRIAPVRAIKNPWVERVREAEAAGATREELEQVYGRSHSRRGILEGDVGEGEMEAGQSSGLIRDIPPAAEVVRRFVEEFERNLERIRRFQT